MQTWARRGIQTALVTGGLLMLGTSIASATENVNPDQKAGPLDGSVSVPLHIANNALGTPIGRVDAPNVDNKGVTVDTSDATGNAPQVVSDAAAPVIGSTMDSRAANDALRGNRVAGDVVAPVDVSGNALAAGGDVAVQNTSNETAAVSRPQTTSGTGDLLGGNVADLDYAQPVQVTGNAGSVLGNAASDNTSTQTAKATGNVATDGTGGTLGGNVVAPQGTTPVQVSGNAVSGAGTAVTNSTASTSGTVGGSVASDGSGGTGTGNAGAVPLAFPAEVNDNSVGALAGAQATSIDTAKAKAGDTLVGRNDRPTYIQTGGEGGTVAGNVAQGAAAGPATVNCNSGAGVGVTESLCKTSSPTLAGGTTQTEGNNSLVSGSAVSPSAALPVDAFANPATVGGDATATDANTTNSTAGGSNFTHGANSTGSGTVVGPTASGPADVFTNAVAGAGTAAANATNDSSTTSGGFTGTSGPGSTAGGTTGVVPVTLPTEAYGNTGGAVGNATSTVDETKKSLSGGATNTKDDAGVAAANLVQGAVAGPVQVIGNGAGAAGNTTSHVDADNTVAAGGTNEATGTGGTLAGNVGQAAVSLPGQVFADNVTGGGTGIADGDVDTVSTAGGTTTTDGTGGLGTGNVVNAPAASAAQAFGNSVAALGLSSASVEGDTSSTSGGDTTTAGTGGTGAGNVVAGQAMPIVQSFGAAVAGVGGVNQAEGANNTDATSGGDIQTDGDFGTISGDLADVPAGAVAQPFGDAVSAVGSDANAFGENHSTGHAGGTSTTSGNGLLSGLDATLPAGVDALVYNVPVEVLADAMSAGTNSSDFTTGESAPAVDLDTNGATGGLGATELPKFPDLTGSSRAGSPLPGLGGFGDVLGLLLGLPGAGHLPIGGDAGLPGGDLMGHLPLANLPGGGLTDQVSDANMVDGLHGLVGSFSGDLPVPSRAAKASAPGLDQLGTVPNLPGTSNLPGLGQVGGLDEVTTLVHSLLGGGLPDVGQLSQLGGTTGLPQLPGTPSLPHTPGMPNLRNTQLVQAPNHLPVQTPALSLLNTNPTDIAGTTSLDDTKARLAWLFDGVPIV
jgi:hypothetical protein